LFVTLSKNLTLIPQLLLRPGFPPFFAATAHPPVDAGTNFITELACDGKQARRSGRPADLDRAPISAPFGAADRECKEC
jgi:hypothetical protein